MQPEKYARRTNTLIFKDLSLQLLCDYLRTSRRHFWENMVPTIPLFLFPLVNASLIFLSENSVSISTVWMSWESKVINVLTRNKTQTNIMNKMKENCCIVLSVCYIFYSILIPLWSRHGKCFDPVMQRILRILPKIAWITN